MRAASRVDRTALLLRSAPTAEDRYALLRHGGGLVVSYLPVLRLTPVPDARERAADAVARLLGRRRGGNGGAGDDAAAAVPAPSAAIVITSPRASVVLAAALRNRPALRDACVRQRVPCYVVGTATAAPLLRHDDGDRDSNSNSSGDSNSNGNHLIVLGSDCGSAANLVKSVLPLGPSSPPLRAVFLCGNTRRNTVPRALDAADHVTWEEVCVYRSDPVPPGQLHWPAVPPHWAVFFSPRGVRAATARSASSTSASTRAWPLAACRHAAIGATTAQAMRDAGISVDAVASSPGPGPLADAMRRCDDDDDDHKSRCPPRRPWRIVSSFLRGGEQEADTRAAAEVARLRLVCRGWLRLAFLSA